MKIFFQAALVASVAALSVAQSLFADDVPKQNTAPKHDASKKQPAGHAFLGVLVSSPHPVLANNLKDLLSPEQGLIVEELAEDSPAAKAGINVHDILTTYDDQKLFSAEQLAKLVHSDRPGREVGIGFLRNGTLEAVLVKLGEASKRHPNAWAPLIEAPPQHFGGPARRMRRPHGEQAPASEWENFDSLTLKKLGDDKFRAEVQYLDKKGKTEKHVFEGTREEIRKSIEEKKDLKPHERGHLLRSLNLRNREDDFPFPNVWFRPGPGWFYDPFDDAF